MSKPKVHHVPPGHHTVTPAFTVKQGVKALAFYQHAFGAELLQRYDGPNGTLMHAEIKIGDSLMMFSDEFPEMGLVAPDPEKPVSASFMVYVSDVDAVYQRAVAAGARPITPVKDEFHGDRMGGLRDPFGHRWIIATHTEDVAPDEMKRRVDAWMKDNPSP